MNYGPFSTNCTLSPIRLLRLAFAFVALMLSNAFALLDDRYEFALPNQALIDSFDAFSKTTGINVIVSSKIVKGITGPSVNEELTGRDALDRLLAGTGLVFEQTGSNAVAVRKSDPQTGGGIIQLREVSITGQKLDRSLFESPESLSIIGAEKLENQTFQDLNGVIRELPNISKLAGGDNYSIRGISGEDVIAYVVDGVQITGDGQFDYPKSLWDIEQIEVLRGPQSSSIGRNALGGAVVVKTADPKFFDSYAFRTEIGSENSRQGSLMVNKPLNDAHAVRITFDYEEDDGFVTAPNRGGEDFDATSEWTGRAKWLFDVNEKVDTLLTLQYAKSDRGNNLVWNDPENGFSPFSQINRSNRPTISEAEFLTINFDINYQLNDQWSFLSRSTFFDRDEMGLIDSDNLAPEDVDGADPVLDRTTLQHDLSQEFRFSFSDDVSETQAIFGVYFNDVSRDFIQTSTIALDTTRLGIPEALVAGGVYPSVSILDSNAEQATSAENFSFFFEGERKLSEKWTLFGGIRYDRESNDWRLENRTEVNPDTPVLSFGALPDAPYLPDPAVYGAILDSNPSLPPVSAINPLFSSYVDALNFINAQFLSLGALSELNADTTFDAWLPQIGLGYQWNENHRTNFIFKQGYRPGGAQMTTLRGLNEWDEEVLSSFEFSHRSSLLEDSLTLQTNAFFNSWKDRQVNSIVSAVDQTIENAAKAEMYGMEFELEHELNDKWLYYVNVGYQQTENVEFFTPAADDISGTEFTNVPDFTVGVGTSHNLTKAWLLHVNTTYQSETYSDLQNTTTNESQFLVNARISYQKENYSVSLISENLLDDDYITSVRGTSTTGDLGARVGDPRTWRLAFAAKF
ncbi:TonB-dependent receptor [Puniceicoccaceae bacterium K14]|nr:TonB-dependent receptor [Puniceicoccaceae bacterium K14]